MRKETRNHWVKTIAPADIALREPIHRLPPRSIKNIPQNFFIFTVRPFSTKM